MTNIEYNIIKQCTFIRYEANSNNFLNSLCNIYMSPYQLNYKQYNITQPIFSTLFG